MLQVRAELKQLTWQLQTMPGQMRSYTDDRTLRHVRQLYANVAGRETRVTVDHLTRRNAKG